MRNSVRLLVFLIGVVILLFLTPTISAGVTLDWWNGNQTDINIKYILLALALIMLVRYLRSNQQLVAPVRHDTLLFGDNRDTNEEL